jgi:DNA-directed RNA polymerase subunit RPC12/RpoP
MPKQAIGITHPNIADELVDQALRFKISPYSKDKVEWHCAKGHTWFATPSNRTTNGSRCPYCSGKKALPGTSDLATTHPDLAAQLVDQSLATKLTSGSNKKVEWRCENGHVWEATTTSRVRGNGCPYCSHRKLLPGYNDLATLRPDLARQLKNPELATTIMPGSKKKVEWICELGHVWWATPNARNRTKSQKGTNCPICAGKKVVTGFNDLATTNPSIARLCVNKEDAKRYTQHSAKAIDWRCPRCQTRFTAKISEMATGKKACPACAKKRAHEGRTLPHCVQTWQPSSKTRA